MKSYEESEQIAAKATAQMDKGHNPATLVKAAYKTINDGTALILEWKNAEGVGLTEFLNIDDEAERESHDRAYAKLFALAKIGGFSWGPNATGDDVATLLTQNIFTVTLDVAISKRSGRAFVLEYIAYNGKPVPKPAAAPAPQPQAARAPGKRGAF